MLTNTEIHALKPAEKPYKRSDGKSLYLYITPTGTRSWRFRFTWNGTEQRLGLGLFPKITVERARTLRKVAVELIGEGLDPREHMKLDGDGDDDVLADFETEAKAWLDVMKGGWSADYHAQVAGTLARDVYPYRVRKGSRPFGRLKPNDVEAPDVLEVCRAIEERGAPDVASDVRSRIGMVFKHLIPLGRAKRNPAADVVGALQKRARTNFATRPLKDLPEMLRRLRESTCEEETQLGIRCMIRMVPRTKELLNAEIDWVDFDEKMMRIPAAWMKDSTQNRKAFGDYQIPLAPSTVGLLRRLIAGVGKFSRLLFPGREHPSKPTSDGTWLGALKRIGYANKQTVHGFRAMFSTAANEEDTERWERIADRQLDHVPRNKVSAAYNRAQYLKERVELMYWWADRVTAAEVAAGYDDLPEHRDRRIIALARQLFGSHMAQHDDSSSRRAAA